MNGATPNLALGTGVYTINPPTTAPRMMRRALIVALTGLLAGGRSAHAQGDGTIARVRGTAFDSLRGRPLADAFIAIVGGEWSATSDSLGHFAFVRVPPGSYQVTLHHATLDTLGFSGLSSRIVITDAQSEMRVSVPSFATLWQKACGPRSAPADSGIVYGTVRDATTNKPIADAKILVMWYDSIPRLDARLMNLAAKDREALSNSRRKVSVKSDAVEFTPAPLPRVQDEPERETPPFEIVRWRLQVRTDESGTYAVCSVPVHASGIRVTANADAGSSDSIDVELDPRVRRTDLRVGPTVSRDVAHHGTVAGILMDNANNPFPYARVLSSNARETRSDLSGRFLLQDVPLGTRRVEVRYVGIRPAHATVEVVAGDTATVVMRLSRVPMLPGMRVREVSLGRVMAAEFDSRRKVGLGYVVDSIAIGKHTSVVNVLRDVPSLNVVHRGASLSALVPDGRGGTCVPTVWMDGVEAGYGNLFDLQPNEVVGLEVYTRALTVPPQFMEKGGERKCGVILVWTRYAFRNR